jgi:pimeloyl-ACP methyl ester carboxylesterase
VKIDLNTHIQDVIGIIDDADLSDIVLVGNSYGGMVISGVADRVPEKVASLVYLDAFVPENGQSCLSLLPPGLRLATVPGGDWLVSPPTSAAFGLKRPDVIALWESKSAPHPLVTLTQPLQLTGGIGRVRQKMYILGTEPARFTRFYDKVKNNPGWTVHTVPSTTFMQLEMPDELTAILLQAIP